MKGINQLPSPYLSTEFKPWFHGFSNAILETSRGCTYCERGSATLQKVAKFDPQRVIDEVNYIAQFKQTVNVTQMNGEFKPLKSFAAGAIAASTIVSKRESLRFVKMDGHKDEWELKSPLRMY